MSPKQVLFADNHRDFLDTRAEFLRNAGYQVLKAYSLEDARKMMYDHYIHLAILDIRMLNDEDSRDTSGLTLAKEPSLSQIPKLILTDHNEFELVREALGAALEGLPPAVGFVVKSEGPETMIHKVAAAFDRFVRINWMLMIRWQDTLSFPGLVNLIDPQSDPAFGSERISELEDLVRKLFYEYTQVTIGRLFVQRKNRALLEVYAYTSQGTETQFVIACGTAKAIADENDLFATWVPKAGGTGYTIQGATAETIHFAATAYQCMGGELEECVSFGTFYTSHGSAKVVESLDTLFKTTLAFWYGKGRNYVEDTSLETFFDTWLRSSTLTSKHNELSSQVEALCKAMLSAGLPRFDYTPHKLTLHLPDHASLFYPNPITFLSKGQVGAPLRILYGVTHGALDTNAILVDRSGQTWLLDFAQVGRTPLVRDFVTLEIAVRLELLDKADLSIRYLLEHLLLKSLSLTDSSSYPNLLPELEKPLQIITHIRQLATTLLGSQSEIYQVELLFQSLARIVAFDPSVPRYTRRELLPFAHSLLLAAMLCEKLTEKTDLPTELPTQAINSLWLDETNKEAWVEGKQVELTVQDYNLLTYLYQHPSQLCSREMIAKEVFDIDYEKLNDQSLINSAISRLRQKIEPDPENPRYLVTVRGQGYKVIL